MNILLDTHIALWAIADTGKLSGEVIKLLESNDNEVFYSVASVWEIAIKHKIRPEQMPIPEEVFVELCQKTGFIQLPIKNEHVFLIKTLERPATAPKHNDPFDRILLAQAKYENLKLVKYENLKLVTHDSLLPYYSEDCIMYV